MTCTCTLHVNIMYICIHELIDSEEEDDNEDEGDDEGAATGEGDNDDEDKEGEGGATQDKKEVHVHVHVIHVRPCHNELFTWLCRENQEKKENFVINSISVKGPLKLTTIHQG